MAELFHALGIEWPILIAQVVNFAILLVVLWKFVYTPVMRLLDARREGVLKAIEREEKSAMKLASAETDRSEILAQARAESQKIIDGARLDGEELKKKLIASAKEEIEKMQGYATKRLHDERSRLITVVKGEIGALIVETIEKTLGDVLDARSQGKMVEQALAILREQNGSSNIESRNSKNT
ncbi:MAG TPA: ATP synthase F0 subunit B [Candidatus Taylorbacteria bacterium]|nr:MAG: ATP synthase subunit b [Parcubacteria group bacterium GW2011_GWA2_47_64]KKU97171.1 MAG: ATP synthase subunit b [Parcubacteria group bacterium GW2011_GWC2_48_17]HBV01620.1 ATP synthase F0 subunit B [Candidatus Taylorbacteria bacterium]